MRRVTRATANVSRSTPVLVAFTPPLGNSSQIPQGSKNHGYRRSDWLLRVDLQPSMVKLIAFRLGGR